MANFRGSFRRILAAFLAIGGALGALYGVALMATAVTGNSSPSSILLGGFGFMLLVLSLVRSCFRYQAMEDGPARPGELKNGTRRILPLHPWNKSLSA